MEWNRRLCRWRSATRATQRPFGFWTAMALAALLVGVSGCQMFDPQPPKRPQTVTEWMKQPRVDEAR